ncbi:MAG: VanZ family protein [Lachnospiraceae bacterium]|nr:VanZ family protein [Lachnospiraceae bacterium]
MDIYQLFTTYTGTWTGRDFVCFFMIFAVVCTVSYDLLRQGRIVWSQAVAGLLMTVFLAIVFGSTVFTRIPDGVHRYNLEVFWSWRAVFAGDREIAKESILNIFLLMPAGVLLPFMWNRKLSWLHGLLAGAAVSAIIETCQLVFCRGLFEWDDMIHNGIGCMVGCVAGSVLMGSDPIKKE